MRRLIVSMIAALVAVSLVPIASAQEEDDQVTLRVGLTQDWEVLNPTSGYTVPAYEVWNLHYATLTDKAADDFATTPGLAESWEEVEPGIEYVYTLREGLTWSDDDADHRRGRGLEHQHRTRPGLGQHGFDSWKHRGHRRRRANRPAGFFGPRPQAPHHGRLSGASAHMGADRHRL